MVRRGFFILISVLVFVVVMLSSRLGVAASVTGCNIAFREIARERHLKELKSNPQLQIWVYEEAGLARASARIKARVEMILTSAPAKRSAEQVSGESRHGAVILEFPGGMRGVWKQLDEHTARELTAYHFDQAISSRLVPITVERTFEGKKGVVQLFVANTDGVEMHFQPDHLDLFDFLMGSLERTANNHLSVRGRSIAIDNEQTFERTTLQGDYVDFDDVVANHLRSIATSRDPAIAKIKAANEIAPALINPEVIRKLRTMSDADWKRHLHDLPADELQLFLERKNRAVSAIGTLEKAVGPSIYPIGAFSPLSRNKWAGYLDKLEIASEHPKATRLLEKKILRAQDLLVSETQLRIPMMPDDRIFVESVMKEIGALPVLPTR